MKSTEQGSSGVFVGIGLVVVALIISLVLVLGDRDEDNQTDQDISPQTQNQTSEEPTPPEQPTQPEEPTQPEQPTQPEGQQPTDITSKLPDNWDQLTSAQRVSNNPYDCDLTTQIVRFDDGTCKDKVASSTPVSNSDNQINLRAVQTGNSLRAEYNDDTKTVVSLAGIRVKSAADCSSKISLPAPSSYDLVPYQSQHWITDYIFELGFYDIGNYICLRAVDSSGGVHTQPVKVKTFSSPPDFSIGVDMHQGTLIVYTDRYLPVGVPAWEYIGPLKTSTGFSVESDCQAGSFNQHKDNITSKSFSTPQHFFHRFDDGFQYHNTQATQSLVLNLTKADVGKIICFRVRNSFHQEAYRGFIVPQSLSLPRVVT